MKIKVFNVKYLMVLSLLVGLSTSLFSQGFIERRLGPYAAKIYTNVHLTNDTIIAVGWGALFDDTVPGKINITNYLTDGTLLSDTVFTFDNEIDYLPWLQGSSKKVNHNIYISGSGGFSAVNRAAWIVKYNSKDRFISWLNEIDPVDKSNNSIVTETVILPSGNIMGVMIESIDTIPQQFFIRLLKWNQDGELIFEKQLKDIGFRYRARSVLLNQDNELIVGVDYSEIDVSSNIQLWKLDTLGNILDIYDSGTTNNEDKECNKIIQTDDGGYIFIDRVVESNVGLPMYSSRITKLSSTFQKEWEKKFGKIQFDTELFNVKKTLDGNFIAVGGTAVVNESIGTRAHLIKFDEDGNVIWESFINIELFDETNPNVFTENYLYDIQELDDGGFIACGQSLGVFVDSFPQQALLIRVDDKGQLNHIFFTPPPELEPLIVYPNPTVDYIRFKEEENKIEAYEIISINGNLLTNGVYQKGIGIDVSFLSSGIYVVRLKDGRMASFVKE